MKDVDISEFKVTQPIKLTDKETDIKIRLSKSKMDKNITETRRTLSDLQEVMYAHNRYSVLIVLQGMDTAGKDSLIREVFKDMNPRGVSVHSFKKPTVEELKHDFLWRHYVALPQRGKFGIFNRSHYENLLVSRVHPEIIAGENLPGIESPSDIPSDFWSKRVDQIINFEKHLIENGTIVLKFFLHLSKKEQAERLLRRIDKQKHNWKFSPGDLTERESWDEYQFYYEQAINQTSTEIAPWFVIPADDKDSARYLVAQIVLDELQKYPMSEPELDPEIQEKLQMFKRILESE